MKKTTKRDMQVIRFLKWIRKHSGLWFLMCTPDDAHMNPSMMKMLIERLAKEGFYEMIFVVLAVHRNAEFMDSVFKLMLLDMMTVGWQGKSWGKEDITAELATLLT